MSTAAKDLAYLARLYQALSPSTPSKSILPSPPFPTSRLISLPYTQAFLVELIEHSSEQTIWKKVFWRRVIKGIEEGFELRSKEGEDIEDEEVREEILAELVRQMSAKDEGPPSGFIRIYEWGDLMNRECWKSVKLFEEGKVISAGTTGLRTWQAGLFLCNHLIADPSILKKSESGILELGSGTGLLSLVLSKLTYRNIVGTDVDDVVLDRLNGNLELNLTQDRIKVSRLDWEIALRINGEEELLKWEVGTFGSIENRPTLILGSDIIYDPVLAEPLIATLSFLLRPTSIFGPSSTSIATPEALISVTIRVESTFEKFLELCKKNGLLVSELKLMSLGENGIVGCEIWERIGEVKLIKITRSI